MLTHIGRLGFVFGGHPDDGVVLEGHGVLVGMEEGRGEGAVLIVIVIHLVLVVLIHLAILEVVLIGKDDAGQDLGAIVAADAITLLEGLGLLCLELLKLVGVDALLDHELDATQTLIDRSQLERRQYER